jgi:hypothetical protein
MSSKVINFEDKRLGFLSCDIYCNGCQKTPDILYVQVTVHRDNLRINNQQDASSIQNFILSRNSTCFGHFLCPSSGVISCTRGNWYVSCRLCGRFLGGSGWNLTVLDSGRRTFRILTSSLQSNN